MCSGGIRQDEGLLPPRPACTPSSWGRTSSLTGLSRSSYTAGLDTSREDYNCKVASSHICSETHDEADLSLESSAPSLHKDQTFPESWDNREQGLVGPVRSQGVRGDQT